MVSVFMCSFILFFLCSLAEIFTVYGHITSVEEATKKFGWRIEILKLGMDGKWEIAEVIKLSFYIDTCTLQLVKMQRPWEQPPAEKLQP
jgi:hypothetical protein